MFFKKKPSLAPRQRARNAATTGAKTPGVFSYRASRSASDSNLGRGQQRTTDKDSAIVQRSKRGWAKRTIRLLVLLVIAILFVANLLLATGNPEVVIVGETGKSRAYLRDASVYEAAARKALTSSIMNNNKVTINVKGVEDSLKQSFPELADVSVSLPLIGRRPVVHLQPSTSRLILTSKAQKSFVLDDSGKAIATGGLTASLRKAGLPEVQDQNDGSVSVGKVVLPSTSVAFITEVARQLRAKDIAIESMILPANTGELHVRVRDLPYTVKFNLRGEARVEAGSYLALKQYLEGQKKTPTDYIDVRVDNRVYYR